MTHIQLVACPANLDKLSLRTSPDTTRLWPLTARSGPHRQRQRRGKKKSSARLHGVSTESRKPTKTPPDSANG